LTVHNIRYSFAAITHFFGQKLFCFENGIRSI
jgi:hypothetical protein